ncbi:MAG: cobalamin-binding protein [Phycisphaerales bacterium]|nr:MAG: cobalamin-binding protein [Phycisphaerales bacterium]
MPAPNTTELTTAMPPRVVSLLPSATEALAAIGGRDRLVGRSHECDFPGDIGHLPVLTSARTAYDPDAPAPSADIDRQVREAFQTGESLYELNADGLRALHPDVILTQDLCEVCSIDLATVRRVASELSPSPLVVSLNPTTLEGVLDDLLTIGEAVGLKEAAGSKVVELRGRLFRAQEYVNPYAEGPVVGWLEWTDPLFVAGHWIVQMIERAGGRHPLNEGVPKATSGAAAGPMMAERVAGKSRRVEIDDFVRTQPGAIVIAPCGLTLGQADAELERLMRNAWFRALPAVRAGKVAVVDGNQMFNRPGPRLIDAFEWLTGWLNDRPELIPPGFPWRAIGR